MSAKRVTVSLTPAQARAVNHALAFTTAGDWEDGAWRRPQDMDTAERARAAIQDAMAKAKVRFR